LASFYWVIDVRGWARGFGAFFAVIGMNSVLIYMSAKFINFDFTGQALFGGLARAFPPAVASVVLVTGIFAVKWALFWFLKRHKVFLRV
jgi:hypothetical protein